MKYYTFYNADSDFSPLLKDPAIKKRIALKITWLDHMMIGFTQDKKNEAIDSYIMLKYGESLVTDLIKDLSPKPGIDYHPAKLNTL
jgi:hypothetical protein